MGCLKVSPRKDSDNKKTVLQEMPMDDNVIKLVDMGLRHSRSWFCYHYATSSGMGLSF